MTVMPSGSANLPTLPDDFDDGLGDLDMSDVAVPRLTILHKETLFKESLSGQKFENLRVIILGVVKQRTLWDTDVEDNERPMCKSPDFVNGYPNFSEETPKDKRFPWEKSGFDPSDFPINDGLKVLPCESCPLKEWGSHPAGKIPWCSEELTLPVLYDASGDAEDDAWQPALLTIKKTGLKGLKQYLASFRNQRMPAFSVVTTVGLTEQSKGSTDYCVPNWAVSGQTEGDDWIGFSQTFVEMKSFITQPPAAYDEDGNRIERTMPSQTAAPAVSQPAASKPAQAAKKPPQGKPADGEGADEQDIVDADIVEDESTPESVQPEAKAEPAADDDDELPF